MNAKAFKTLVIRELWEHRSLVWAPVVTAALLVIGTLLSAQGTGSVQINLDGNDSSFFARLSTDPTVNSQLFGIWTSSLIVPQAFVGFLVMLGCALVIERQLRAIGKVGVADIAATLRNSKIASARIRDRFPRD